MADLKRAVAAFDEERESMSDYNRKPLVTEIALLLEAAEVVEAAKYGLPIEEELVDTLKFLLVLAVTNNIDLTTALLSKLEINRQRFPADRFTGSADDFPKQYMDQKRALGDRH